MPPVNNAKQTKYNYLPLASLQSNTKVNVYGVVKFVKQPYKSRGSDYCMMLSIVDQSQITQDQKLKCLLFANAEKKLPPAQVGDVIRFHRLTVSRFAGDLQGQSSPGFSWVLFSGDPGGTLEPKAISSQSFILPDDEKQKIEDLRSWASGHGLTKTYSKFKNIAAGCYFDTICQVISTCIIEEDVCLLLQVWDGTQTIYTVRQIDTSNEESQMNTNPALQSRAEGFVYDLCIFDDHLKTGLKIKPGDYIELCNLHAAVLKTPVVTPLEMVELVLHRGTSFGRGVRVLEPDADIPELKKLKEGLENICASTESQNTLSDSDLLRADENIQSDKTEREKFQKGGNFGRNNTADYERPSTSRENIAQRVQTDGSSSSSVQIIESVQTEQKHSVSEEKNQRKSESGSSESVHVIDSDQNLGNSLKRKLNAQTSDENIHRIESVQTEESSLGTDLDTKRRRQELDINSTQISETIETGSRSERQSGSLQRCMLKTSTIILNHPNVRKTNIADVLKHEIPYKFKVRARVYDYHPKPVSVDQFLHLHCRVCHYLCHMPGLDSANNNSENESQLQIGSTFKGVPHYNCPRCLAEKDSLPELDSPPHLSYTYMMRLLLKDDTGWLLANIWKSDAETFFRDITPEELIQNKKQLKLIEESLHQICPDKTDLEEKPWIECCIRSYSTREGTGFQIFDTVIA